MEGTSGVDGIPAKEEGQQMEQALQGVKVIDFSQWLPGQYCGMVLADFGADVVKVERPGGDPNRAFAPQLAPGQSSWNLALNRNKRGLTLQLKTPEGRAVLRRLLEEADVFLEGFRPGYLESLGLGWETVRAWNPRLIYCSITGFGQTGKYCHKPAHDLNIVGLAGLDFLTDGGQPAVSEVQVSAIGAGLNAVTAISLALLARERTGQGQRLDISLYNTALSMQIVSAASVLGCRVTGDVPFGRRAHYYDVYRAKDGRYVSLGTIEPKFWGRFCDAAGLPELKDRQYDFAREQEITAKLKAVIATRTRDEWVALTGGEDGCVTPVCSLDEALDSDLTAQSGMLETRREDLGEVTYMKPAIRLSGTPGQIRFRAPAVGEHTEDILRDLGYTEADLAMFREKGAI